MGKRIWGDSLNGLRIVLFWILMGFVAISLAFPLPRRGYRAEHGRMWCGIGRGLRA